MTDTDELKRLAEMAEWMKGGDEVFLAPSVAIEHADDILALIAENEARDKRIDTQSEIIKRQAVSNANICQQRDEAVALLRECLDTPMEPWDRVRAFLARIDGQKHNIS